MAQEKDDSQQVRIIVSSSYRFTHAIVRTPPSSAVLGLRANDVGNPDVVALKQHHMAYVSALEAVGVHVTVLPALEEFPDSLFVEDTALCLPRGAVILRPGAPTRRGEAMAMADAVKEFYPTAVGLPGVGTLEGGDILAMENEILIGISNRSTSEGIAALAEVASPWGYQVREVTTPAGVLHFKSDCSLLDETTVLSTRRLSASGCFDGYTVIDVAEGEEPAANSIRVNDFVFMPEGFPHTSQAVRDGGFEVVELPNSECQKIDGGLSCLSLRFSPA